MTTIYDKDAKFDEHNIIISPIDATVGMGATLCLYSDSEPFTISRVSPSGKTFWMKQDDCEEIITPVENASEKNVPDYLAVRKRQQKWTITQNPENPEIRVNKTANGWKCSIGKVEIGYKVKHYDYLF